MVAEKLHPLDRVCITRTQSGTLNDRPLTGRVYVTGPHFDSDIFSSTEERDQASPFERREAERLLAIGRWRGNTPRIIALPRGALHC